MYYDFSDYLRLFFGIFTLLILADRLLFAATQESKSTQKFLSDKLEIKSKQILIPYIINLNLN